MNDDDSVPARDPTDVAELLALGQPSTSPRAAGRLPEPRRLLFVALATATGGACVGWLFRQELLDLLIVPWRDPPMIIDSPPYGPRPGQVLTWHGLVMAAVALLASLPFLSWLVWRAFARRSCPANFGTAFAFVSSSYLVIALGLWLAADFAFPAFVEQEQLRWRTGFGLRPVSLGVRRTRAQGLDRHRSNLPSVHYSSRIRMGTFSEAVEIAWLRRPQLVSASHEHCYVGQTGEQRPWRVNDDRPSDEIDVVPFEPSCRGLAGVDSGTSRARLRLVPEARRPRPRDLGVSKRLSRV
jgi:hypothetical protein